MNLLFGVHNHQPVGNFPDIFKKANQDCYRPFIDTLYNYAQIKATLHFSGSLIDWLLKNDPALLQKVREMVKRNQVEILTGAYYEPILPIIPERDILGQINMLTEFVQNYFRYQPQGMWIAERVWEPQLVKTLVQAKIKYILLDDSHFYYAGIKKENLLGYYMNEEKGQSLAVFPISKRLRYLIPFSSPSQSINYLKNLDKQGRNSALTIVDDGEKFGLWPGTHQWVYQQGWLEGFFQLLIKSKDWLNTQTIGGYMASHKPLGLCQLPAGSYEEMISWSGGCFRNFFSKYPEANHLHKRMLYVSEKLDQAKSENKQAQRHLYMAQCNCPYWHGVFGGIYLGHLRHSAYKNLIAAQSLVEKKREPEWIESEVLDFDHDGQDELIVKNPLLNIFIAPGQGGSISELDYKPECFNLMDALTRRPEPYHEKIRGRRGWQFRPRKKIGGIRDLLPSKEKGLGDFLIYDSYRRLSLLDHFFWPNLSFKDFRELRYEELGDFINAQYSLKQQKTEQGLTATLQRQGKIRYRAKAIPLLLTKKLSFSNKDAQVFIEYNLENLTKVCLDLIFGIEFNISLENQLNFCFDKKADLWSYPLQTISASESGFERNYQQTVILPHWPLKLENSWQLGMTLTVKPKIIAI